MAQGCVKKKTRTSFWTSFFWP